MRREYWLQVKEIDPENLVFIDEMGVLLGLTRTHARSPYGSRVYDFKPFYRGSKVTVDLWQKYQELANFDLKESS